MVDPKTQNTGKQSNPKTGSGGTVTREIGRLVRTGIVPGGTSAQKGGIIIIQNDKPSKPKTDSESRS